MAASALDVLSLAEARLQCRADDGAEIDMLLTASIEGAVSYVSRMTGTPLVDSNQIFNVLPATKDYLILPTRDVKGIERIRYWRTTGSLRLEPQGSVSVLQLGRTEELEDGRTRVWGPASGWPTGILEGSCFVVTALVGFDIDDQSKALREAVILMTRQFFENPDRLESDFAVVALLDPWKRYN